MYEQSLLYIDVDRFRGRLKRSGVKRYGGETAGTKQWGLNDEGETSHNRN
jgi:hypothetical protein